MLELYVRGYLVEHLFEVLFRLYPRGYSITEEDKVLHYSVRVHTDHVTQPSKGGILLLIVTDVT